MTVDRQSNAREIGQLEVQLSDLESKQRSIERRLSSAKGNRTAGAVALLVGILGFLFLYNLWPLWIFLGLIGLLTLFGNMNNEDRAKTEMATVEKAVADTRGRLAEIRALMM